MAKKADTTLIKIAGSIGLAQVGSYGIQSSAQNILKYRELMSQNKNNPVLSAIYLENVLQIAVNIISNAETVIKSCTEAGDLLLELNAEIHNPDVDGAKSDQPEKPETE
jgi:hypothetical protein